MTTTEIKKGENGTDSEFTDRSGLSKRQEVNQENSILKVKKIKNPELKF